LDKISTDLCKIVTFHHHLLPIPQTGRERNILLDSGDLLRVFIDHGVDFVLNGHKHVPNLWMLEKMVTLNSGTATTRKLRGQNHPSYNELIIKDDQIVVNLINTETGYKRQLANYWFRLRFRVCNLFICTQFILIHFLIIHHLKKLIFKNYFLLGFYWIKFFFLMLN